MHRPVKGKEECGLYSEVGPIYTSNVMRSDPKDSHVYTQLNMTANGSHPPPPDYRTPPPEYRAPPPGHGSKGRGGARGTARDRRRRGRRRVLLCLVALAGAVMMFGLGLAAGYFIVLPAVTDNDPTLQFNDARLVLVLRNCQSEQCNSATMRMGDKLRHSYGCMEDKFQVDGDIFNWTVAVSCSRAEDHSNMETGSGDGFFFDKGSGDDDTEL